MAKQQLPTYDESAESVVATEFPSGGDHLSIERAEYDGMDARVMLDRCYFFDIGFKKTVFREGKITHSRFERCYLRNAEFRGVDLTGTTFTNCNLGHASFDSCKLDYVTIENCQLEYDTVIQNLPAQPNLKRHLLRSIRVNAAVRRDVAETRLLLAELAAERDELYATFTGANSYFRQKPFRERVMAFVAWSAHQCQKHIWGYGLQLRVLLRAATVAIVAGAAVAWSFGIPFRVGETERTLGFLEATFFAICSFTTLDAPGIAAIGAGGRLLMMFESVSGAAFLGLLAATAFRKIAR